MDDLNTYEERRVWIENAERVLGEDAERVHAEVLRREHEFDALVAQIETQFRSWQANQDLIRRMLQRERYADTYTLIA